jgi:hypothetical protein
MHPHPSRSANPSVTFHSRANARPGEPGAVASVEEKREIIAQVKTYSADVGKPVLYPSPRT